jgi:hypothetical protein
MSQESGKRVEAAWDAVRKIEAAIEVCRRKGNTNKQRLLGIKLKHAKKNLGSCIDHNQPI